jgi:hypothetical protein
VGLKLKELVNVNRFDFEKSVALLWAHYLQSFFIVLYAFAFLQTFQNLSFSFSQSSSLIAFLYFRAKDYYAIGVYTICFRFCLSCGHLKKKRLEKIFIQYALQFLITIYSIYNVAFQIKPRIHCSA